MNNSFRRYSARSNSEFDLTKKLRIGQHLQVTYLSILGQGGANGGQGVAADENDILSAFRMPSIIPVYDEFGGYGGTAAKGFNNPRNPVATRDGQANNRDFSINGFGNVYAEYDVISGLTLRTSLGGGFSNYYNWGYSRLQYENSENNSAFGYNESGGYSYNWVLTNTAQYKKQFGMHNLDVLVGQEALNTGLGPNPAKGRNMWASGLDPFSNDPDYINMSLVNSKVVNSRNNPGVNFYSVFGRVNYILNDKYILTGVIRRDGSSVFGSNVRYGVFPAFSAAWRISSEDFMKDLTWINDLKIRGGYGTMGNSNNVNANNQFSIYGFDIGRSVYDINGTNSSTAPGYYRQRIGNPNAKWETSVTKNIGFDGNFFNGKLDVIVDLWQKDTKDLLMQLAIPATNGFDGAPPAVNVGSMRNQGIDILLGTKGKIAGTVGYDVNLTAGFVKNEITKVGPGQTYLTDINPGFRGITPIRNQLGYSISSFYGYQVLGLFQSAEEVKGAATQEGAAPGRFRYADLNGRDKDGNLTGKPDGKIDSDDRTYLGSPVPKFTAGSAFGFKYKNFDLYGQLYGSFGNKIFNVSKWFTDFYPSFAGAAISERVKDSWLPSNTNTDIPIFETASNFSTNTQSNSFYVEDGSYVRLQTLTLGYTFPSNVIKKAGFERLRISASTNNVFTISKYQGLDPGVGGNADTQFGIDVGNYPVTRSWNLGINLGF
jgi:TonB-linked SusC/RagA family outer membrane protein